MSNNAPVKSIRIGAIKAAVWKNEADGKVFYSVTFSRSYKTGDGQSAVWKDSDSFGFDDLLTLSKLADLAHSAIMGLREQDRAAKEAKQ